MIEVESKLKKWGNSSLAFIIPKEITKENKLKENQKIKIILEEEPNVLKETFGLLKNKITKSTDDIMKEVDNELWGE